MSRARFQLVTAALVCLIAFEAAIVARAAESGAAHRDSRPLAEQLGAISHRGGGSVGVAVTHVETGETVALEGAKRLPLYSVFKLPLAVAVLQSVEEGGLSLDKKLQFTPADVAQGSKENSDLWKDPIERTVRELLELSIIRSDNTSADALLKLVGGPEAVTRRIRALGFSGIEIRSSVRDFKDFPTHPNTGSAEELARLLSRLQKGEMLSPASRTLLLDFMARATTGPKRLRGKLPQGTPAGHKTGTGDADSATNDVGLITLPGTGGHLAIAVLVSGSMLSHDEQERLIADLARAAYDHYAR